MTAPTDTHAPSRAHVFAAKMHLLDLEPIKQRLGGRWPRMSLLVQKLVSTALKKVQTREDHFEQVDELSYVASFHSLSRIEAEAALAEIVEKVCEKLFGAGVPQISVRSVTGTVPSSLAAPGAFAADAIGTLLEKEGSKTVVSVPRDSQPACKTPHSLDWTRPPEEGWLRYGQKLGEDMGLALRYAPVWELQTGKSRLLALTVNGHLIGRRGLSDLLRPDLPWAVVDVEIAHLFMTVALAQHFKAQGQIASLMVGVSYETMARRDLRLRYLGALAKVEVPISCPVLLRLERIPNGAVVARIAQLSAMLAVANLRVVLSFQSARTLPPFDLKLGVAGIGAVLPPHCDYPAAALLAQEILRRASDQKCLAFLHGLDTTRLALMAEELGIRFGTGLALDKGPELTGLEEVPQFPLDCGTLFLKPDQEEG